jgi:PelA/Pel-15E family pectate lyase
MFAKIRNGEKLRWVVGGLIFGLATAMTSGAASEGGAHARIPWNQCLIQKPDFYASDEAVRIADNVLLYQRDMGGWPKGIDMAVLLSEADKASARKTTDKRDSTIDNGATHTQIRYLAEVYYATKLKRFREGLIKGVDYLLEAQYPNGGWPQFYPFEGHADYSRHITFNDGAVIGAMSVLHDVAQRKRQYAFIDPQRRERTRKAIEKGVECILKCQIIVDGKPTAWCQQYDERTLEPRPARSYEKVSICGPESVDIVRFLMGIDRPSQKIIKAIEGAVVWFNQVKLTGIRQVEKIDQSVEGGIDKVIIEDANAPPIWARFYQIGTNRPIFCGRDGIVKYGLAEIEHERRTGYAWYGHRPAELLAKDYPAWRKKWTPAPAVLLRKDEAAGGSKTKYLKQKQVENNDGG